MRAGRWAGVAVLSAAVVAGCRDRDPSPARQSWTISASASAGGTIAPSGSVAVPAGGSQTFTITPSAGFVISDVVVDGVSLGPVSSYVFSDVGVAHAIAVSFVALPTTAVVRLVASGSLPPGAAIGGVRAVLTYATGKGLSCAPTPVVPSGVATSALLAANANEAGRLIIGLVHATGIGTGEVATATFSFPYDAPPGGGDFAIDGDPTVVDLAGAPLPGVTVAIGPPQLL